MKTRALLLLTSMVFVSSACSEGDVTKLGGEASWIVGRNKPQSDLQVRHASTLARTNVKDDADDDADHRDMDDAVESAGATAEDGEASAGAAAPSASESTENVEPSAGEGEGEESADETGTGVRLIDGQIAAVLTAANQALIAQAQAALPKLSDVPLRALAADLAMQHMAAQARQEAIVAQKRLTTKENPVSAQLAQDAAALLAELDAELACDGERAYLTLSSELHEKILALFKQVLAPSVCDGELKTELLLAQSELTGTLERTRALWLALDE